MLDTRWSKLIGDLRTESGRVALMLVAIAVSLTAVGTVLGAYAILTREISKNYLGTRPADATLELRGEVTPAVVAEARRDRQVSDAEAREVVVARVQVGADWRPLLLFVVDDFHRLRLNTFRRESGAWPPPEGTMLLERAAGSMLSAGMGEIIVVKAPHGPPRSLAISGTVHDPGLAPAWQEREGYGYITRATLRYLGEPPAFHELRVKFRDQIADTTAIEAAAHRLGSTLAARGFPVHEIRVPPPGQHPHQRQMTTVLLLMLTFSVMALVLSAILVATSLAALLARQVREIGVMKALGARTGQLVAMYVAVIAVVGAAAVGLAVPLGRVAAASVSARISVMLNFNLTSVHVPWWLFVVQAAAGLAVPVLLGLIPILRATRVTVRVAISQHGTGAAIFSREKAWWPRPVRDLLRRPARLGLTVLLLAAGGAMFMTALNVERGWQRSVGRIYEDRHYDVEVRFNVPEAKTIAHHLGRLPGVATVECWGYSPAAFAPPGLIDVVRTYPDRSHGSLAVLAPPVDTKLINFPVKAGHWLRPRDQDGVVLNHVALAQIPYAHIGDAVTLSIEGVRRQWRLIGVVEELGSSGVAYVSDQSFASATGTAGRARMLRIATEARSPSQRKAVMGAIERVLAESPLSVDAVLPLTELRTAIGDHIVILIQALIAMSLIMAIVGTLGLVSTLGISVTERTREFGIMKTVGATPAQVTRMLLAETAYLGTASWILAYAIAGPLTFFVDRLIGNLGFLAPLPLVLSGKAALFWLLLVAVVSLVATLWPARRAGRLTVRDALVYL